MELAGISDIVLCQASFDTLNFLLHRGIHSAVAIHRATIHDDPLREYFRFLFEAIQPFLKQLPNVNVALTSWS